MFVRIRADTSSDFYINFAIYNRELIKYIP